MRVKRPKTNNRFLPLLLIIAQKVRIGSFTKLAPLLVSFMVAPRGRGMRIYYSLPFLLDSQCVAMGRSYVYFSGMSSSLILFSKAGANFRVFSYEPERAKQELYTGYCFAD